HACASRRSPLALDAILVKNGAIRYWRRTPASYTQSGPRRTTVRRIRYCTKGCAGAPKPSRPRRPCASGSLLRLELTEPYGLPYQYDDALRLHLLHDLHAI